MNPPREREKRGGKMAPPLRGHLNQTKEGKRRKKLVLGTCKIKGE